MRNYFVRFLICCLVLAGAAGCRTATLDTKYSTSSRKQDYEDLSELISAGELQLLKDYLNRPMSWNPADYTYGELLKNAKFARKRKIMEEQRKAEEKKLIEEKTELLCSRKWKLKNIEFVVDGADDSVTGFEATAPAMRAFSRKRWKIYAKDSIYQEITGKEIRKGGWRFEGPDEIRESRPVVYKLNARIKQYEHYVLTIDTLDNRQFRYIEERYFPDSGHTSGTLMLVTMESGD